MYMSSISTNSGSSPFMPYALATRLPRLPKFDSIATVAGNSKPKTVR